MTSGLGEDGVGKILHGSWCPFLEPVLFDEGQVPIDEAF